MEIIISVIVPIYQVEKYIENSIKSICNQTFKEFEVILVDDGTLDKSILLAESIIKNSNIQYTIIRQDNQGVSAARNIGIKEAKGKWIICIDPDDVVSPDLLSNLYLTCINFKTDVSFCDYQKVDYDEIFMKPRYTKKNISISQKKIIKSFLKRKIVIISPSMLINKEFLKNNNIFYNEKIRFSEDQHFIWHILFNISNIGYVRKPLYNYFIRENSTMTSSNIEKIMTGYNGFVDLKNELSNGYSNKILSRWVFGVMRSATRMLDYEEYKVLTNRLEYKRYIKSLINFPKLNVKILTIIMVINLNLFYKINKRI